MDKEKQKQIWIDMKEEQKRILIDIMNQDEQDGLYNIQTAVDWLHEIAKQREPDKFDWEQAKAMEKEQIKNALILFCDTESYGACDIKDWVKNNGVIFKDKDTDSQIVDRVDYFVNNILNHNI